jgi:TrmH family RNA methyltransferase
MGRLFALEVGGALIDEFPFPESGTVVLGSEELGVSPEIMKRAESDGGVVSIPLPGPKTSLNVGVAFGILAHCWNARRSSSGEDFFQSPVY